jgi:DNA-directed RNA polymerase
MIFKPNVWSEESFGGFLDNVNKEVDIITGSHRHNHLVENKKALFKSINYLNSIKFSVNNTLLEYLEKDGKFLLDLIKENNDIHRSLTELGKLNLYVHGANNHNESNISKESFENRINCVKKNYNKIINLDKSLILNAEKPFIFLAFCLNMRELHNNPLPIIKTPVFLYATCSGIQHLSALLLDLYLGIPVNLSPNRKMDLMIYIPI